MGDTMMDARTSYTRTTIFTLEDGREVDISSLPKPVDEMMQYWSWQNEKDDGTVKVAYMVYDEDCDWELMEGVEAHVFDDEDMLVAWIARRCYSDDEDNVDEDYYSPDTWVGKDTDNPTHFRYNAGHIGESRVFNSGRWGSWVGLELDSDYVDPEAAGEAIMSEYHSWVEGDCWGIVSFTVLPDGTLKSDPKWGDHDTVWGFIGMEYTEKEAKRMIGLDIPVKV